MSLSQLHPSARLFLLGYVSRGGRGGRCDTRRALALGEVVFLGQEVRRVARDYGMDPTALRRLRNGFRALFPEMLRAGGLKAGDLVVKDEEEN